MTVELCLNSIILLQDLCHILQPITEPHTFIYNEPSSLFPLPSSLFPLHSSLPARTRTRTHYTYAHSCLRIPAHSHTSASFFSFSFSLLPPPTLTLSQQPFLTLRKYQHLPLLTHRTHTTIPPSTRNTPCTTMCSYRCPHSHRPSASTPAPTTLAHNHARARSIGCARSTASTPPPYSRNPTLHSHYTLTLPQQHKTFFILP